MVALSADLLVLAVRAVHVAVAHVAVFQAQRRRPGESAAELALLTVFPLLAAVPLVRAVRAHQVTVAPGRERAGSQSCPTHRVTGDHITIRTQRGSRR